MIRKVLCWLGFHSPQGEDLGPTGGPFAERRYRIVCFYCKREAAAR